jgi:hypothetical protein
MRSMERGERGIREGRMRRGERSGENDEEG